jgi:hypothetical protein
VSARERLAAVRVLAWRLRRVLALAGVAAVAVTAVTVSIARGALPDPRRVTVKDVALVASRARAGVHRAMLPAPLAPLHGADPATADCNACHDVTARVPDAKCMACHEGIVTNAPPGAAARASSVHASFEGRCRDCHADHRDHLVDLDREGFNHARARFPLEGEHARARCEACHEAPAQVGAGPSRTQVAADLPRMKFQGVAHGSCTDCHVDPHGGAFAAGDRAQGCTSCHDSHGWKGDALRFDHGASRFPLEGAHARADCEACHRSTPEGLPVAQRGPPTSSAPGASLGHARLRGTPTACAACHLDPHQGTLAPKQCDACHRTTTWKGDDVRFDHDRDATFALRGAHAALDCARCHDRGHDGAPAASLGRAVLRGVGATDCNACHQDPHQGGLAPKRCDTCHDAGATAWKGAALTFDHGRDARFALDATHAPLDCKACHETKAFRPLETSCAGCHTTEARALEGALPGLAGAASPDPHAGLVDCERCHLPTDRDPQPATFAARCAACHTPRYGELFLAREQRLGELLARGRAAVAARGGSAAEQAALDAFVRQGHHAFAPAARALEERGR